MEAGMEKRRRKWTVHYPAHDAEADRQTVELAAELGCSATAAKLLWNRDLKTAEAANRFLRAD